MRPRRGVRGVEPPAAGEVFLKLVKLLEEMGIVTVRQALEAAEKTYFARVKY